MPAHSEKRIFTYQTRVTLSPDHERALADYAALFCRVERTLHADLQSGKPAEMLKSKYLLRFGITARQFNAAYLSCSARLRQAQPRRHRAPLGGRGHALSGKW